MKGSPPQVVSPFPGSVEVELTNFTRVQGSGGLEQRVDEGGDRRPLRDDYQRAEQRKQDQDRQQPEFFSGAKKSPNLGQEIHW